MKCCIDGCENPIFVLYRKLCKTHYHRVKRAGDIALSRAAPEPNKICSIEGCGRAHKAKGLCGSHYAYLKVYGSPTPVLKKRGGQFKEGDPVSTCKSTGYVYVWKREEKKVYLQHRLEMEKSIGRKMLSSESVHHKNGNRSDNSIENLELWNKSQPAGQRVEDKCNWAIEILKLYRPEVLK